MRSSAWDRWFLVALIVLLPLQDHLPSVRGYSVIYLVFAAATLYVFAVRFRVLIRTFTQPLFFSLLVMLGGFGVVEIMHPHPSTDPFERIVEMAVGAAVIATLCRDERALRWALVGYVTAGLWLSVLIFRTSYGTLNEVAASDFAEASRLRGEAFADSPIHGNLNAMAHVAAQGAAVALAFALTRTSLIPRVVCFGCCAFCALSALLPLSRGGFLTLIAALLAVLAGVAGKAKYARVVLVGGVLVLLVWTIAPKAVFSRLKFNTEAVDGKQEARARLYTAAWTMFPEYVLTGVGAGNYLVRWAVDHGFERGGRPLGPHNCFLAVTIYWGLIGLAGLLLVIWQVYRLIPRRGVGGALGLGLRGIAVTLFMFMLFAHTLYDKGFSLGMGLLAGAHTWVWPAWIRSRRALPGK